jgi:2-iminobutanoate/2-iminopropanoate deaminase
VFLKPFFVRVKLKLKKNLNGGWICLGKIITLKFKTTIFLSGMEHFSEVNQVYGQYFSSDFPARETVAVKGLPRNVNVEISMIATI